MERSEELDVEIGTTATELDSRRENDPREGDRDRQLLRAATGPDVALINGGGIRANKIYEPGTTLTRRDILSELPFGKEPSSWK